MILFVFLFAVALSVRMDPSVFSDMIDALIQLEIIADSPSTIADWNELVRLNVTEPPECPFANNFYSCDKDGALLELNLTAPPLSNASLARRLDFGQFANDNRVATKIRLRNFVGDLLLTSTMIRHFEMRDSIVVNASRPVCDRGTGSCKFFVIFQNYQSSTLVLSNVTILDDDRVRASDDFVSLAAGHVCRFQNVSMACPIPDWLAPCFNVNSSAMVPCVAPVANASGAFVPIPRCVRTICRLRCTPSPLETFDCADHDALTTKGYFPSTPGFSTIEFSLRYVGFAYSLTVEFKTYGLVTRVELYDWHTLNWTAVDFPDTRAAVTGVRFASDDLMLPPVLTSRVRVTVEQWFVESDVLYGYSVSRTMFGQVPKDPLRPPIPRCAVPESFNSRSNLDESIGDSYCVGRICQLACQFAPNFTFDRAVVPQFVVIDGGSLWTGAELIATPSDQTRVYRYNVTASAISSLNISADLGSVSRVSLIGDPARNEPLPTPTLPPRGFPGIVVKRWFRALPVGFANVTNVAPIATCPQLPANVMSSARVSNSSFVFTTDGNLLQCSATSWEPVVAKLTAPILNRDAPVLSRKLVAVGDRLLGVIVASNILHDGSVNRLLVNRRAISTAIDILDVRTNVWFTSVLQHDIRCCNISDVDVVVHQNQSAFGVVDRLSGAASVLEWRPLPYELVECASNTDCRTCLTNEANIERCRWCDSQARCAQQASPCDNHEPTTTNVALCMNSSTTTSLTSTTAAATTTTTTSATSSSESSTNMTLSAANDSFAMINGNDADPLIPLYAVLGVVGGLVAIGAVVAVIWKLRKNAGDAKGDGDDSKAGDIALANRNNQLANGEAGDERYTAFDEAEADAPATTYDDSSALR